MIGQGGEDGKTGGGGIVAWGGEALRGRPLRSKFRLREMLCPSETSGVLNPLVGGCPSPRAP